MKEKDLYDYYLWYNKYEKLWYAIPRDKVADFHNGTLKEQVLHAKDSNDLIKYLN